MDVLGWFQVGLLVLAFGGATLWGRRESKRRAAAARAWAQGAGFGELAARAEGVPGDLAVRRRVSEPSFVGVLGGHPVSVINTRTTPRFGMLWVFCAHAALEPVFIASVVGFATMRLFGRAQPAGWNPVEGRHGLEPHFLVSLPPHGDLARAVTPSLREALLGPEGHAWCLSAGRTGFVALWYLQPHGADTGQVLVDGARLFEKVLAVR